MVYDKCPQFVIVFLPFVYTSIDFNDQLALETAKISHEKSLNVLEFETYRVLPLKFPAFHFSVSNSLPEDFFSIRALFPQFPGCRFYQGYLVSVHI